MVKETVVLLIRTWRGVDEKADEGPDEKGVQGVEKCQAGKRSERVCMDLGVCACIRSCVCAGGLSLACTYAGVFLPCVYCARAYVACIQLCMCAILVEMQAGPRLDPREWRNNTTGSSGMLRQFDREWRNNATGSSKLPRQLDRILRSGETM